MSLEKQDLFEKTIYIPYLRDHGDHGAAEAPDEAGHVDQFHAGRDPRQDPDDGQGQRRDA